MHSVQCATKSLLDTHQIMYFGQPFPRLAHKWQHRRRTRNGKTGLNVPIKSTFLVVVLTPSCKEHSHVGVCCFQALHVWTTFALCAMPCMEFKAYGTQNLMRHSICVFWKVVSNMKQEFWWKALHYNFQVEQHLAIRGTKDVQ